MPLGGVGTAALIGGGIAGIGAIGQGIEGLFQKHKANELEKSLKDPTYVIPQEFYQNREMARQMAQIGLPQQQYNNAVNGQNQSQAAAIAAASRSSNPGAAIEGIQHNTNTAHANLDAEDAQARNNNQRYLQQANTALAGQELAKQQNDVFDKYTRDFNQMQAYRGAGNANLNGAFNAIGQIGGTIAGNAQGGSQQPTMGQSLGLPILPSATGGGVPAYQQQQQSIPYYQIAQ